MPDSSCSALGTWGWCLLPAGVLLIPGSRELRVGEGGALVVLAHLGGLQALDGNFLSREPSVGSRSLSPAFLPPLQFPMEALIDLLLYQEKEGGR